MKKKIFFNYNFLQKIKLLADNNIVFKKEDYLVSGLCIILYELLNHRQSDLKEYVSSLEGINGFIKIDIPFPDVFVSVSNKFKLSVNRILNTYKLKDYINLAHSDILYIEEKSFSINIKTFLLRYQGKNNQYIPLDNYEFINNVFKELDRLQGKKTQDILYCLSLGLLLNISKDNEFSITQVTKQKDCNISRIKKLQEQYLELLIILKAIDTWEYNSRNNSYIINKTILFIKKFSCKTFAKEYVKDIYLKLKTYKLDYLYLFNEFQISITQKRIIVIDKV